MAGGVRHRLMCMAESVHGRGGYAWRGGGMFGGRGGGRTWQ